jgi:hypothetical protein
VGSGFMVVADFREGSFLQPVQFISDAATGGDSTGSCAPVQRAAWFTGCRRIP